MGLGMLAEYQGEGRRVELIFEQDLMLRLQKQWILMSVEGERRRYLEAIAGHGMVYGGGHIVQIEKCCDQATPSL